MLSDAALATGLSAEADKLVAALQAWDFECPTGFDNSDPQNPVPSADAAIAASSKGWAAFHVLWPRLRQLTFADDLEAANVSFFLRHQPMALAFLRPAALSKTYWDDLATVPVETREQIVALALESAATFISDTLGTDADKWRWGALHQVDLPADLFGSAGIDEFNAGPFMNDGALSTVDVASPLDDQADDYHHIHGASIRLTCEAQETGVSCNYELPGSQRHHRGDGFYNSLLQDWLGHQTTALPFSINSVIPISVDTIDVQSP